MENYTGPGKLKTDISPSVVNIDFVLEPQRMKYANTKHW